jgi:hypothetical protein
MAANALTLCFRGVRVYSELTTAPRLFVASRVTECGDSYLVIGGTVLGSPVSGHRRACRSSSVSSVTNVMRSVKKRDMALFD